MWIDDKWDGRPWGVTPEGSGQHEAFDARLAVELAIRVQAIVPDWVTVRAVGTSVLFLASGQPGGATLTDLGARPRDASYLANVGLNVLSYAQDIVSEASAVAWPPVEGDRSAMKMPQAEVRGDELLLWYGDDQEPVFRCAPLRLSALPEL